MLGKRDIFIQTLKEFLVRAVCNYCNTKQTIMVRWIRRINGTVTAQVLGKTCIVCRRYPGDWMIDQAEVMTEYNPNWGPITA